MLAIPWIGAWLSLCLGALVAPRAGEAAPALEAPARAECFALWGSGSEPIGRARLLRRDSRDAHELEWQCELWAVHARFDWIERRASDAWDWIWRERAPAAGRTLRVRGGTDPGRAELVHWGEPAVVRAELALPRDGVALLQLGELLRARGAPRGLAFECFDPLAAGFERVELFNAAPAPLLRAHELRRADGGALARWCFTGGALLAFEFGANGPLALRVSADAYDRLASGVTQSLRVSGPPAQ